MNERAGFWDVPRDLISSMGEIVRFCSKVLGDVFSLRAFKFFGEALRQSSILIFGSMVVICGLMFIIGLTCGIEAAYLNASAGAPSYAGFFAAWCDLREAGPYAFGYMMSAKVGTGIVAELGAMRVTEEIDALDVMGLDSLMYLCASRLLACWMAVPFMYLIGIACCYLSSYLAVVIQIGQTSSGGYFLLFWTFQNPADVLFSLIKGISMATMIVLVGCYYGYTAGGGPVGVGRATAKSMVLNAVGVHIIGMIGTQIFWGKNPRAPVGG
jgi:phospholipid/cholesterol/gamma-HCH transport system permease protein